MSIINKLNQAEKITQHIVFYTSLLFGGFTAYIGLKNLEEITNAGFQYTDVSGSTSGFVDPAILLVMMGFIIFGTGCQIARMKFNTFGDFYFTVFNLFGFIIAQSSVPTFAQDLFVTGLYLTWIEQHFSDFYYIVVNVVYLMLGLILFRSIKLVYIYRDKIKDKRRFETWI